MSGHFASIRPSPDVFYNLIATSDLTALMDGGDAECENCHRRKSQLKLHAKHHHFSTQCRKVLCDLCFEYFIRNGKMRNPKLNGILSVRRQLQQDRKAGQRIACTKGDCMAVEHKSDLKKFVVSSVT
ncbi:hypothetical protein P170DRAFT_500936 [Aspergillus steynii IBT 23096]|uniref:Uncharacterized protein n=1 Tax=Aspergillus steynii IBT 23096 TaxID=1392250 RepID=A0A2I2FZS4_9EURO|nr:uncharacterized protein P170DRAFT_500936 [Aspergillus steynii IBT 23096]PLB46076.1 hypothetical protein P170DRAFT_500936 [Aspergillus steynii IBT 23096]